MKPAPALAARASALIALAAFCWIAAAPHTLVRARGDDALHVTVMDVGQGDAVLVTFPDGLTMGVDGGGVARAATSTSEIACSGRRCGREVLAGSTTSS